MILDVFDKDLFFKIIELRVSLDDSHYVLECIDNNNNWTFLCYYVQQNKYNNINEYKRFIRDFTNSLEFM